MSTIVNFLASIFVFSSNTPQYISLAVISPASCEGYYSYTTVLIDGGICDTLKVQHRIVTKYRDFKLLHYDPVDPQDLWLACKRTTKGEAIVFVECGNGLPDKFIEKLVGEL